ncbi:MAG: hypothetical protein ACWA6Y_12195 [Polaromonas sp.]
MRPLFFSSILLLCGLASAQPQNLPANAASASAAASGAAAAPAVHPLVGRWAWVLPGKSCGESLTYRTDGTRSASSGQEQTQSRYEISAMPSLLGFYRLSETVTQSNNQPDCAGDVHPATDEPVMRFVQFSPRHDQFIVCKEEELKACYGPLKRMPE